ARTDVRRSDVHRHRNGPRLRRRRDARARGALARGVALDCNAGSTSSRRAGPRLPRVIGEVTFGVIGLLFLFADLRTFSSTFQQTFFSNSTTQLAVMATAVFATSFLALVVAWRLGPARALGIASLAFVVATFSCPTSR